MSKQRYSQKSKAIRSWAKVISGCLNVNDESIIHLTEWIVGQNVNIKWLLFYCKTSFKFNICLIFFFTSLFTVNQKHTRCSSKSNLVQIYKDTLNWLHLCSVTWHLPCEEITLILREDWLHTHAVKIYSCSLINQSCSRRAVQKNHADTIQELQCKAEFFKEKHGNSYLHIKPYYI